MRIAAGRKKIPTDNIPRRHPIHSRTVEATIAGRRRTSRGTSATSTGTDTTTRTHAPSTENELVPEQRDTPPGAVAPHVVPSGAKAATSAPTTASTNAATTTR